ncbi:unnamed protein product [Schistosoma mattheei]|uniref:Uncharacterized protein n=1 Tax=Schistosoma mattheei TaxID=31246 RepID=A0A3P8JKR7_9TREM|nr:unnamed protein product [Schistosoma mattheei]
MRLFISSIALSVIREVCVSVSIHDALHLCSVSSLTTSSVVVEVLVLTVAITGESVEVAAQAVVTTVVVIGVSLDSMPGKTLSNCCFSIFNLSIISCWF